MPNQVYRFSFLPSVDRADLEATLLLAAMANESLHGIQTELDACYLLDPEKAICVVDASTRVGRDFNRLFVGFLNREFDRDEFQVQRVNSAPVQTPS